MGIPRKRWTVVGCAWLFAAAGLGAARAPQGQAAPSLPPYFEPNHGQAGRPAQFIAHTPGYALYLEEDGRAAYLFPGSSPGSGELLRMELEGARAGSAGAGEQALPSVTNWYGGADPAAWRLGIPHYARVRIAEVYPRIDLVWKAAGHELEFDFEVAAGGDPGEIRMRFHGSTDLHIDERGDLVVQTAVGALHYRRPSAWQGDQPVPVRFLVAGDTAGFSVQTYDRRRPLLIDPVLRVSSPFGGTGFDAAYGIAADLAGDVYITGETASRTFLGQAGARFNRDVFVARMGPNGTPLRYVTILAGAGNDAGRGIAVDSAGNAYIAGIAGGGDFPTTAGAPGPFWGGQADAFAARLDASGRLQYSTYLGAGGDDGAFGIATDSAGNAYITGYTGSLAFPITAATPQRQYGGGAYDAFLVKLAPAGGLVYSALLGGSGSDQGRAVAVDGAGNACMAGRTDSPLLPLIHAAQPAIGGGGDALVACLNAAGTAWNLVSYFGGRSEDEASGIAIDNAGRLYIAGNTLSANFPVTGGAAQTVKSGGYDAFAVMLANTGSILYATLLGGNGSDAATSIAVDRDGNASVAGYTTSQDFPVMNPIQPYRGSFDVFVCSLTPQGGLSFSTHLGGADDDRAWAVAMDATGGVWLAGHTVSADFPLAGTFQPAAAGSYNAFLLRVTPGSVPVATTLTPATGAGSSQVFTVTASHDAGFQNIEYVFLTVGQASVTGVSECSVAYNPLVDVIWLVSDDGAEWLPYVRPGAGATVSNSQCTLNASGSSAAAAGNTVTVRLSLTFSGNFSGLKGVHVSVLDTQRKSTGWRKLGEWTVPAAPVNRTPVPVSVTPAGGSGSSQTFTVVASDEDGAGDMEYVYLLLDGATPSGAAACQVVYNRSVNLMWLVSDDGAGWPASIVPGSSGVLENNQCTLSGAGSSGAAAGNTLTARFALTFKRSFAGARTLYAAASDFARAASGWRAMGNWTVPQPLNRAPAPVSVSPASGVGTMQTFTVAVSDEDGYGDIEYVYFQIGSAPNASRACALAYNPSVNRLWLTSDDGATWLPALIPGGDGTVSNSQCTISAAGTSAATAGNTVTFKPAVTFKDGFAGEKGLFFSAVDFGKLFSGWRQAGSWTVPGINRAPAAVSVSPSSGSGTTQTFTAVASDEDGYGDIEYVFFLVDRNPPTGAGACSIAYNSQVNLLWLVSDDGAHWPVAITPGSPVALSNSQCTLNGAASSATLSGSTVTLRVSLTFKSAFAGQKNLFVGAVDTAIHYTGWRNLGAWTVP